MNQIVYYVLSTLAVLLILTIHEYSHAYAAYKLGDNTAKNLGRLSLNPIKHLDPMGFLCMLLAGFGWANPVPINSRNFKKPRKDIALTSVAGPVSNLLLAFVFVIVMRFSYMPINKAIISASIQGNTALADIYYYIYVFIYLAIHMNITLAVFNLLPIPPLDGSKILYMFLPPKTYFKIAPYERYISLAFMLLLLLGVISPVLSTATNWISNLMFKVVGLA